MKPTGRPANPILKILYGMKRRNSRRVLAKYVKRAVGRVVRSQTKVTGALLKSLSWPIRFQFQMIRET